MILILVYIVVMTHKAMKSEVYFERYISDKLMTICINMYL